MTSLLGIAFILMFAGVGAYRGGMRMGFSLAALLVASLMARPLGGLGASVVGLTGQVPLALLPIAGIVAAGLLVFIGLMTPCEIWMRRRQKARVESGVPAHETADRWAGSVLGGIWGCALLILCLTGLAAISGVQKSIRLANAEIDYRQERRHKETLKVQQFVQLTHTRPPADHAFEFQAVEESQLKPEPPGPAEQWAEQVDHSIFAPIVTAADPVDPKVEKTLRDLTVVAGDPYLYERFAQQPQVQALTNEPKLVALSNDPEISSAIKEKRYRDLLNNPKLVSVLDDHELVEKLKAVKIDALLHQVRTAPDIQGVAH